MPTQVVNYPRGESLELLHQYQQSASKDIRNRIVQLNIGLVRKEVHHWVNQCTESYEDLLQVGCIGLIRAIERFDLSKGHAFSSFAIPYIRGEIQHYLRDKSPSLRVPRQWLTLQRQSVKVIQQLQLELKRPPTDGEVAEVLGISVNEWNEVRLANSNRSVLSLDAPIMDGEDGATCLGEMVPDGRYRSFQLAQEDQIRVQQALAKLEDGTRKVLEFVFLYDLTQKETAERLGISSVTVSRRVKKGLSSLQKMMSGGE
ncbi:RNA polymerase sigma factor SigF [Planktothrix agardhii]|jgi:RNA polymerase sigma-B factor|uniref:RNA polymerase sigma factor SigF n=1 Tax=Planktothrix agardhii TaxID=1160 RepID=UPI0020B1B869|nr:RNA polymerase sigma factor SigF [Planktothrix agardhii]MEA5563410.1 RNA polymerase sigma factor SigF [Planktothrix agardhii UHCC 0887]CAD5932427.1 RNA polymerase sigma-B factor [Planktothrix agardhii]CAH2572344.1 RNA polymerase sigma-B factor [Planktothrix rubescens]